MLKTEKIKKALSVARNEKDHRIVCIGASAGGMEAIHELFDNIPQHTGFSFILIQHLSSDHKSLMAELLSKHTMMNVIEARDKAPIAPDTCYVIPNNKNIIIRKKKLHLTEKVKDRTPNMPIDVFLTSLAKDAGDRSIAVILSGTGTDGTKGIAEIKKAGGLVFVQDPLTAKFDGMPVSAIQLGKVDFILSPVSIAEELVVHDKVAPPFVIVDSLAPENEPLFMEIMDTVQSKTSIDFKHYKRPTIIRRLTKRMAFQNCKDISEYITLLKKNDDEAGNLTKDFLVGVSSFFRDYEAFEELKVSVIPEIVNSKGITDTIKVWIPACSTGEEAYSIAMLIKEHVNQTKTDVEVKIFATDLNRESIDFASKGCYDEAIVNDLPRGLLAKYFTKDGRKYKVVPQLRKMVVFSPHDLLKDPPFGKLDLISCRNMLIYVSPPMQKRIMAVFHFALNLHGYLFLGPSENIGDLKESMREINRKWRIYKNIKPAKSIGLDTVAYTDPISKRFSPSSLVISKEFSRKGMRETILNKVLDECSIAGAMVDNSGNIIETFGDYRRYLHLPEKKFDHNFLKMIPVSCSVMIGANFTKAIRSKQRQVLEGMKFSKLHPSVTVTIKPFEDSLNNQSALILFREESEKVSGKKVEAPSRANGKKVDDRITLDISDFLALQDELRETKELLKKSVEDAEVTNEELQSTNEELVSSNEELQSANEELQSLNEELHTVNSENQLRIREISELNDDLNNYFRSSDIGQIFIDKNLAIRKYTPAATALVNLIETDIGRPFTHISHNIIYPELLNDIKQVLQNARVISKTIELENHLYYQMKILPYLRDKDTIDGVVLIFVDVTGIKSAERTIAKANQELKELNDSLVRSNRELEQFAYITSHDLQEPLRKIQTFSDLAAKSLTDISASKKYLDKIFKAANRMSLLIKDVLSYSRLTVLEDEGFEEVDLGDVLRSVIEDYEFIIQQRQAKIRVSNLHPVKGMPLQIHQLFSNLLGNSLKFCEKDPEIDITTEEVSSEALAVIPGLSDQYHYIKVTFSDNGIGFEQSHAERIFTIFQRLNRRDLYEGTGIGLSLCKRIVENHHGAIFASSAVNCGATFTIYLPALGLERKIEDTLSQRS